MDSKEKDTKLKQSSRRRFLKGGAVLAGLAAVGGIRPGRAQFTERNDPRQRLDFVPEESVPKEAVWRDPWTGEMLRDPEGNLVVDWTGTPQWETSRRNVRAAGGPRYGWQKKDTRLYGERSRFVISHRLAVDGVTPGGTNAPSGGGQLCMPSTAITNHASLLSPGEHQLGIITPNGLHFVDEHGEVPEMDPRQHRLTIHGMVDRPRTWTMEELMRLPSVSRIHTVECNSDGIVGNPIARQPWTTVGDRFGELSCSEWTGVLLSTLFEMVGVQRGAKWFYASAADEYNQTWSLPVWKAMDDAIVAYGQNGEPVQPEQGFPLRLLLPGFIGTMNIKRLKSIKITSEPALFHRMYTAMYPDDKITWFRFEHTPKSCILSPSGGMRLTQRGFYEVRGIAWSGGGKITRVEITVDGGKTWKDAEIQGPVHSKAHTRFVFPWSWNGEEVIIASRCTDERGTTQPTTVEMAKFMGLEPDIVKTGRGAGNSIIQPWKINREGRVTNAIFSI